MKTNFVINISTPIPYLAKPWVSSYGLMCCQPIKLQGSLKCNISREKWMINFIFGMQMNIEVFYNLILKFWLIIIRYAQSTQNKFAYLCSISRKAWVKKLIFFFFFCLQINTKNFYRLIVSLQVCKFTISLQYLKEKINDEVDCCLLMIVEGFFKVILSF